MYVKSYSFGMWLLTGQNKSNFNFSQIALTTKPGQLRLLTENTDTVVENTNCGEQTCGKKELSLFKLLYGK